VHNFQDTSWTIANLSGTAITCTSCHNTGGTTPALKVSSTSSHVFANGTSFGACTDCHASHADATAAGANVIYVPTRDGSNNAIPTMTDSGGTALYGASPHNYRIQLDRGGVVLGLPRYHHRQPLYHRRRHQRDHRRRHRDGSK